VYYPSFYWCAKILEKNNLKEESSGGYSSWLTASPLFWTWSEAVHHHRNVWQRRLLTSWQPGNKEQGSREEKGLRQDISPWGPLISTRFYLLRIAMKLWIHQWINAVKRSGPSWSIRILKALPWNTAALWTKPSTHESLGNSSDPNGEVNVVGWNHWDPWLFSTWCLNISSPIKNLILVWFNWTFFIFYQIALPSKEKVCTIGYKGCALKSKTHIPSPSFLCCSGKWRRLFLHIP
jgi:hypothetical protein